MPIRYGVIGYVLSLLRILGPDQTTLYQVFSNGIVNNDKIYRYKLPQYVVKLNESFKEIDILKCHGLGSDVRLCSRSIHVIENNFLTNQSFCDFGIKDYNKTEVVITSNGYFLATKASCSEDSVGAHSSKVIPSNGVIFQPHNFTGALVCSDGLSVPSETRNLEFDLHYTEPFIHQLPRPSTEYKVEDWTDYNEVRMLETNLASQVIKKYSAFSKENQHFIWPVLMMIIVLTLISGLTAAVYCYCKGFRFLSEPHSSDYHRVRFRSASHQSLHPIPVLHPSAEVAVVTPQVTVELVETPAPVVRKKAARRVKRQLRSRSASSSADERPTSSGPFEPEGGLDF